MNGIILTFETVTYAIKAGKLLRRAGIYSRTVKVSSAMRGGCTHGLEISEDSLLTAASVLRGAGIEYSMYNGDASDIS